MKSSSSLCILEVQEQPAKAVMRCSVLYAEISFAAAAGICSHTFLYIKGEWHLVAPRLLRAYLVLSVLMLGLQGTYHHYNVQATITDTMMVIGTYAIALFISMTIYRVFFHRLRKFPGPFLASVTKLWHVFHTLSSQNHVLLNYLHDKYGDFVRTGT